MKIYYYTVMATCLMVLFSIAGFDTSSSFVFSKFGLDNLGNYQSSAFFTLVGSLFAVIVAGIIVGSITRASPQWIIKSSIIMPILVLLVLDFVWIINAVEGWVKWIIFFFLVPLISGYAIALIEFWEGRD